MLIVTTIITLVSVKIKYQNEMDKKATVAGLDVHKNAIYLCIIDNDETVIF